VTGIKSESLTFIGIPTSLIDLRKLLPQAQIPEHQERIRQWSAPQGNGVLLAVKNFGHL
jgi:hypothetical protein